MNFLERQLEDPLSFKRLKRWCTIVLVVVVVAEIVLPLLFSGHHYFAFEGFPAWGSIYGLISCVAIIVVSKLIGKLFLMRREDHYDE